MSLPFNLHRSHHCEASPRSQPPSCACMCPPRPVLGSARNNTKQQAVPCRALLRYRHFGHPRQAASTHTPLPRALLLRYPQIALRRLRTECPQIQIVRRLRSGVQLRPVSHTRPPTPLHQHNEHCCALPNTNTIAVTTISADTVMPLCVLHYCRCYFGATPCAQPAQSAHLQTPRCLRSRVQFRPPTPPIRRHPTILTLTPVLSSSSTSSSRRRRRGSIQ